MNNKTKLKEITNLNDCFNGTGTFITDKAFIAASGKLSHKAVHVFDEETHGKFELSKKDAVELEKAYPNAEVLFTITFDERKNSSVNDDDDDGGVYVDNSWVGSCIKIISEDFAAYIDINSITIYFSDLNFDYESVINKLDEILKKKEEKPKTSEVRLVVFDQSFYSVPAKINKTNVDINKNYNDDFKPVYDDLVKFIESRECGLVIMNGIPGSGKTTCIRHLITNYPGKYILVTNAVAESLASPEFMSFMLDNRDSVFILEDCEQVIKDRDEENNFSGAISNILNMTDGIMSDVFNIKFICTFNANIETIDKALLRKGRCYVNYEFKKLCAEKTKAILNERGIVLDNYEPMTLAEIYNYDKTDCTVKKETKIGF